MAPAPHLWSFPRWHPRHRACRLHLMLAGALLWMALSASASAAGATTESLATEPAGAAAMIPAAESFLASLSRDQRRLALRSFEDPGRTNWHYFPKEKRKGIALSALDKAQRALAMELLRASLSPEGYSKAATIMRLEEILRRQQKSGPVRDPERYHFTLFGAPSSDSRWGLSIEGHHLSCNFVVEKGRIVSATPLFFGANPAEVTNNAGADVAPGTRILEREETLALELFNMLDPLQQARAHVAPQSPWDMREGHLAQTETTGTEGLSAGAMTGEQQRVLLTLCASVIGNAPGEIAEPHLRSVRSELHQIRFACSGKPVPGDPYSYRIQGPSTLILLFKTQPDGEGNPANHTHYVWRTPGQDFGAD